MTEPIGGFSILAITVGLSLSRPKLGPVRIHPSTAAVIGALLTVSLHILPLEAAAGALSLLARPIATIAALMLITLVSEEAGVFDALARWIAEKAQGSGRRLFAYLFLTGALTGLLITNDAAVLIFTPLALNLVTKLRSDSWTFEQEIPFYFSVLYVANVVGAFVVSNPINLIVASIFEISFLDYAAWMSLPALASVLVSFAGIFLFFRRSIPATCRTPEPEAAHGRRDPFRTACTIVLALVLVGFFVESSTGLPVWMVAVIGAVAITAIRSGYGRARGIRPLARGIGWDVIVFVAGIFIVSRGLREIGLTRHLAALQAAIGDESTESRIFATGFVSAISSALMNNHPTADTMSWVIRDGGGSRFEMKILALAALIGGDLGPKMLPIGSLAALLWFRILRQRRVHVPYALYVRIGIPVSLVAVALSLLVLNTEVFLVRYLGR